MDRFLFQLDNTIILAEKYQKICKILFRRFNLNFNNPIRLNIFEKSKYLLTNDESIFYNFLKKELNYNYNKKFYISFENKVTNKINKKLIKLFYEKKENFKSENIYSIFMIVLYRYQLDNESGYLFDLDFSLHLERLQPIIEKIKLFCEKKIYKNLKFQYYTEHPNFPMTGIIDAIDIENKKIIDIKFTKSFHIKQAFQLLMYYNNVIPNWSKDYELVLIFIL